MITAIDKSTFDAIPNANSYHLKPQLGSLTAANGQAITVYGSCTLPIHFGGPQAKIYHTEVLIANINSKAILGMNFMLENGVAIDFATGTLSINGLSVLATKGSPRTRTHRVKCAKTTYIPPRAESIIPLSYRNPTKPAGDTRLVQPSYRFSTSTGLFLGRTLVNFNKNVANAIVVNPSDEPVVVDCGVDVGFSYFVDAVDDTSVHSAKRPADCSNALINLPPHLEKMIPTSDVDESQQQRLRATLSHYADCFMSPDSPPGKTGVVEHEIHTGANPPIRQRVRRVPFAQHDIIEQELDKMLDAGVIEPSTSPWASPVVLVTKKDGSTRFCVDFRRLNNITVKDSYPLPNIEDTFNAMSGANYFCALDLASGYWQIPMAEDDRPKTAFITRRGLFQFRVMPFGLCNAPATFERLMEAILRGLLWERCMVYIDDIIVFGRSYDETLANLQTVLERIQSSNLKLKPSKCELFKQELLYLGFLIDGKGVRPDPAKVQAVRDWYPPCNLADVRSFLGFANYHRRFIKNYASIASPLTRLTRKKVPFQWSIPEQTAFEALKRELMSGPMLSHALPDVSFILDTDASAFALGGVLSQRVDGIEQVVAYASQTLSKSQTNYCTTHRELLGVVEMIRHFRHYLWGRKFLIRTDHSSLRWLTNYRDADGMLARWLTKLQQYDFHIEHRPGRLHGNADGLSRCHNCKNPGCRGSYRAPEVPDSSSDEFCHQLERTPLINELFKHRAPKRHHDNSSSPQSSKRPPTDDDETYCANSLAYWYEGTLPSIIDQLSNAEHAQAHRLDQAINNMEWLSKISPEDIKSHQRQDPDLSVVIDWFEQGKRPDNKELATYSPEVKCLVSRWKSLRMRSGILYREAQVSRIHTVVNQLVVPASLREILLHQLHDLRISGHLGIQRTIARVQRRFYWPGCSLDVAQWCAQCPQCMGRKGKPAPSRLPMSSRPTGAPFERIGIDILDTRQKTARGFQYILVVSDYFTKYTDAFPLRRHTARIVADILATRYFNYHGVPMVIHSDQGTEFESKLFRALVGLYGSEKIHTAPYRPQSDGQVERFNRTLLNMLSAYVSGSANDWDNHLPFVIQAYNTSVHTSTGITPHAMVYGHEMTMPIDLMYPDPEKSSPPTNCGPEYVEFVRRALRTAHQFAREHLKQSTLRQKRGYDAHAKPRSAFKPGDLVRYYYPPARINNKFARPWIGPFRVLEQCTEVDYRIELISNPKKKRVVHHDSLKSYEGSLDLISPHERDLPEPNPNYPDPPDLGLLYDLEDPMEIYADLAPSGAEDLPFLPEADPVPKRPLRTKRPPKRLGWESNLVEVADYNPDISLCDPWIDTSYWTPDDAFG